MSRIATPTAKSERRFDRKLVSLKVQFYVDKALRIGTSLDISKNGMLFETSTPLELGQHIRFEILKKRGKISGDGEVVRMEKIGLRYRVGVHFLKIDKAEEE